MNPDARKDLRLQAPLDKTMFHTRIIDYEDLGNDEEKKVVEDRRDGYVKEIEAFMAKIDEDPGKNNKNN